MSLIGIIAKNRDFKAINRELQEYNIDSIQINRESINNIKNIVFDEIVILEDINLQRDEYECMSNVVLKTKYLIVNADIEINIFKYIQIENPIKVITFGFNPKSTVAISSINEEKVLVSWQRNINKIDGKVIEAQEMKIKIKENISIKIYNEMVIFIVKKLHNL